MFTKLKQFKDLRDKAKHIQDELSTEKAEGSAAWGKVKIVLNGNQHVESVSIDPSLMTDRAKLEETIRDATNDGMQKIQKIMASKLKDIGGMDLAKEMQDVFKK